MRTVNIEAEREKLLRRVIESDRDTGHQMATLRKKRGLTAARTAREMGISAPYLSDLEHGRRHWNDDLVEKYRKVIQ